MCPAAAATAAQYIIAALALFAVGYGVFSKFNMGLARNSRGQQQRRYLIAAVQAVLPAALMGIPCTSAPAVAAAATSILWMCTFNVLYHLTHRATSPDYDNHMDIAFGIYLFGWLTAGQALAAMVCPAAAAAIVGAVETVLVITAAAQIAYYATYRCCIDEAGIGPLMNTYLSEAVEYVKSFKPWKTALAVALAAATAVLFTAANAQSIATTAPQWWATALTAALFVHFSVYIWKPRHGLFVRTGLAALCIDVRQYTRSLENYRTGMAARLAQLSVERNATGAHKPHTVIMVIGESSCRDYMSAFARQPFDTTPWERTARGDGQHFVFFDNAYSCAMQTVPSLERVLTERNQYNDKDFASSCSIIDIARKAGYATHWYSNQSYIGVNDTSVTLVAQTADTAKWVKKTPGGVQYDTALLDFLDEIDPTRDNFVVLHLKGSHFNYENRYPHGYAEAHSLPHQGDVECYRTSLHFTDTVLHRAFDYARQKLNLALMVYFSDHGGIPDMRRSPRFLGFKMVRIPLWVYMSDRYQTDHPDAAAALKGNARRYFTNDLVYELMCGLLDITSDRYDPTASIASATYRFRRSEMLTYDGRIRIADDDLDTAASDNTAQAAQKGTEDA